MMNWDIVPQVTGDQQAVWQEAADTWRLPYWDWAADPSVPSVVRGDAVSDLGMAAYDPIFWLHHCNVDRQFAIYQNHNGKDQWLTGATKGTDPTPTDNLYPFHTDTKFNHWNSDGVKGWTTLGYTYPDLAPETDSSGTAPLELVQKQLTEKYGVLRRVLHEVGSTQNIEGLDNDYVINIIYNRFPLNGVSYSIHFFIGKESDIPESPEDYKLSVDYTGGIHTFSSNYWTRGNENGVNCENCQKQQNNHQLSKGQLPVTLALLQRALHDDKRWAEINHLGKDHVVEYMTKHLQWRAAAVPNQLLKTDDLPDLKVFFKTGRAEHPEDPAQPSKYFGYEPQWGVTKDKFGGAKPE